MKISVNIEFEIEGNTSLSPEEIAKSIVVGDDDVHDGWYITTSVNGYDCTRDFFLGHASLIDAHVSNSDDLTNEQKSEETEFIWAVKWDYSMDCDNHSGFCLYKNYEEAKCNFDKLVNLDKTDCYNGYESEDTPYSWEEENDYWCIWKEGYYSENHSEIKLVKVQFNNDVF